CPCWAVTTYEEAIHEQPVDRYRGKGLTETGLLCPACGVFTRSHWMDDDLRQQHGALKRAGERFARDRTDQRWQMYQEQRKVYARHFESAQEYWRKKLGVKE